MAGLVGASWSSNARRMEWAPRAAGWTDARAEVARRVTRARVMRASDARGAARPKAAVDAAISRVLSEVCRRGTLSQR